MHVCNVHMEVTAYSPNEGQEDEDRHHDDERVGRPASARVLPSLMCLLARASLLPIAVALCLDLDLRTRDFDLIPVI